MKTLFWLGLGAAAMYLLDPEQGRRRRALMRDQAIKARRMIHERASGGALRHEEEPSQTPSGAHHLGR
jgi:hypothetical protein